MASWLHLAAARHPDRVAIEAPERSLTYAELSRAAIAGAGVLLRQGVGPGQRVALMLPGGADFVVALHACLLAEHPVVPIDLRLSEEERTARRAGAELVIDAPLLGEVPRAGDKLFAGMPSVDLGGRDDAPLAVMHTSGTTAAPKPVVLSRGNFHASALGSAVALGLDPAERWLCPMPLTHVGGLSIPVRSVIYGTTVVLHGRFDADSVLRELMDPGRRITLVSLVPTTLTRLLDAGLERPPAMRWALLGGGPIAPALLERAAAAGVPVAPTYGMTEACSQIATFGWPLPGVEVALADGEILVRGPIVAQDALAEDGWLHTGDLGRFDRRGRLQIVGRRADTIVTGGENVAPAEVEAVLLEHPDVADAGVHARPDDEWGEAVVALVVTRPGADPTPEALREFCAARLARFKVPKTFAYAEALPRTASGKLLRRDLARVEVWQRPQARP
jgi:O-succinylbenzoic acid--CoA ligase